MIQDVTIDGKPGLRVLLDANFVPVTRPEDAVLAKLIWPGGAIIVPAQARTTKYNPSQPRDQTGRWAREGMVLVGDRSQLPPHIQALRVPPAWTDVQIATDPDADLLVVGKDAKGRDQYIYSERFREAQAAAKFERVAELNERYDDLHAENADNMASDDPDLRAHAEATALIMETGLRPGSERDTGADVQAYGATTLLGQHVVVEGDATTLVFTGKKGVDLAIPVANPTLAATVRARAEAAGPDGPLFPEVSQSSLSGYVGALGDGAGFKTKDLRTALGTRTARAMVEAADPPTSPSAYRTAVRTVAREVSTVLGNTPTVALQSYIDPTVFGSWRASAGVTVAKAYDPSQPRDDSGRWTDNGAVINESVIARVKAAEALPMGERYVSARDLGVPVAGSLNDPLRPPTINERTLRNAETAELSFSNVQFAQNYLDREKLTSMLSGPIDAITAEPLTVLRQNGDLFIVDGTHRGAAQFLSGQLTFNAKIVDAREPKTRGRR